MGSAINLQIIYYIILVIYTFSLFPSLSIPYMIDDVDHLHNLAAAIQNQNVTHWMMTPHNEHVIPLLKLLYWFGYTHFGLDPEIFHAFVLLVSLGIVILIYHLCFLFTKSKSSALIAASIYAGSNLIDPAIFVGTNSHIVFCMFFFLVLFISLFKHGQSKGFNWALTAFLSAFLLPSTFALGLTSIFFIILFNKLCLSPDQRNNNKQLTKWLLLAWLLSLLPYVYSLSEIIFAEHYSHNGRSAMKIARFAGPFFFIKDYIALKLIPKVMVNPYLSFGLFFLSACAVFLRPRKINWKPIVFLICFGMFNNFIIFVFRSVWGNAGLETPRYYVFPIVMCAFVYGVLIHELIKDKTHIKSIPTALLVYVLCLLVVASGSFQRYQNANTLLRETMAMQSLYVNFKKAFTDYFIENPGIQHVTIKNGYIPMPSANSLNIPNGPVSWLSRYRVQSREFYAQYILPPEINKRIIWSDTTDPDFLKYLETNEYMFLAN